jgi:uncharacterized radical SAM superfamily Fe-S cluster-containing enzyme
MSRAATKVERMLGIDSLSGKDVYLIRHVHSCGSDTYVFSTKLAREKALKELTERHDITDYGNEYLEESTAKIDKV